MKPNTLAFLSTAVLGAAVITAVSSGCNTEAYCFSDCGEGANSSGGSGAEAGSTGTFTDGGSTATFIIGGNGEGGAGPCSETNGGVEICDGVDNDCNGATDDIIGIDYGDPHTCGVCMNNCYTTLINYDPSTITCTPSADPGEEPGICNGTCAQDYYDLDGDESKCEYYCVQSATNDAVCDNKDDDCDGSIDEDVDLCTDEDNCGKCGGICFVGNGQGVCIHDAGQPTCDQTNTHCEIDDCDPGWVDLDDQYATGCEYSCTPTGPEVCGDQIDNDCDGLVDGADDLSGDVNIGIVCHGDPDGICGLPSHAGVTDCVDGLVKCTGANVLFENQVLETCNGNDDDCDGQIDDQPTDAGGSCGQSNVFPCTFGTLKCQNGALLCDGDINPGVEICNGQDDDCGGDGDLTNGMPPMDSIGACNVPVPPPPGATSPCTAGTKACVGGTVQCQGSQGPTSPTDTCGVDANCDGQLTNQPIFASDSLNCNGCGNNCNAMQSTNHAIRTCVNSVCTFSSCQPGYHDLDGNGTCEYGPCFFVSATEACNNQDDNCNGLVDESVTPPSPKQVCGVSPAASAPECTTNVVVTCSAGAWQCAFPANVCSPTCATAIERCDGLDNDCDGLLNENVPDYGQPCASDDSNPGSQGACRTTGTKICNGFNATQCGNGSGQPLTPANCSSLPGGCTELCDGVDNDCDGSTDEPFSAKGTNATFYYKPKTIALPGNTWIYQQEASRPAFDAVKNPTGSNATVPGTGNGYWTSAPPGEVPDRTPSCSEPTHIPWFNVTPDEAEQTCAAAGGFVCSTTNWRDACHVSPPAGNDCLYGYGPFGANNAGCHVGFTAGTKFCNLGPSYDFNTVSAGDQDGLLPTQSPLLLNCYSPWDGVNGNPMTTLGRLFDITGNLREITKTNATTYTIMGGAFNSAAESGSSCDFTFYQVDDEFKFFDTGFRCCFSANPG